VEEQRKLIYREVEKSQGEILNLIESYDGKIHHIFIMATTSIILLFAFSTFALNIFLNYDISVQSEHATGTGLVSIIFFVISLIFFVFTLKPCSDVLHIQKIAVLDPTKFYKKYGTLSENKLLEFLIIQTSSHFEKNKKTLDNIRRFYDSAIKRFDGGIVCFIGFIACSLLTILYSV
jgi:hypothetical protein